MYLKDGKIFNNSTTRSGRGTERQSERTEAGQPRTIRPESNTPKQCGVLLGQASLAAFDEYHKSQGNSSSGPWSFPSHVHAALGGLLNDHDGIATLTQQLRDHGLFDGNISNNLDDIESRISGPFQIDREAIKKIAVPDNTLYCYAKVDIQVPNWDALKTYFEGSPNVLKLTLPPAPKETKEEGMFSSLYNSIMGTKFESQRPVFFCQDEWHHKVGAYNIPLPSGHNLQICITDLNSYPQDNTNDPPQVEEIVASHSTEKNWEDVTEIDGQPVYGFTFIPFSLDIDNPALSQLLGASKGNRQVVGVQTKGRFQVNQRTACNFLMESLVVQVYRSCGPSMSTDGYYKFYNDETWQKTCYNLLEIKIDGKIIFYSTYTEKNKDGC